MLDPANMPSGRELDAAVAYHIYDWRWLSGHFGLPLFPIACLVPPEHYELLANAYQAERGRNPGYDTVFNNKRLDIPGVPSFTGNDVAAFQVAEDVGLFASHYMLGKMRDGSGNFAIIVEDLASRASNEMVQREGRIPRTALYVLAQGATRAEALCRGSILFRALELAQLETKRVIVKGVEHD